MRFSLATLTRRTRNPRRSTIAIRPIQPTAMQASDLYRGVYQPIVSQWDAVIAALIAEYERSLPSALTRDSVSDLQSILDAADDAFTRLILRLTPTLRDWTVRQERWHREKWRGAVLTATGVDLRTMLGADDVAETMEAFLGRNVALVRDVSAQARGRIADIVFRGFQSVTPARDVAKELRGAVEMSRRRSMLIAQDQTQKLAAGLDTERMRQAGIEAWLWRHSGKLHPRAEHKARDMKEFTFAEPPADLPGELPYCGCRKQAVLRLD